MIFEVLYWKKKVLELKQKCDFIKQEIFDFLKLKKYFEKK